MLIEYKTFNKNKAAGGCFNDHSWEASNTSYLKEHNEEHNAQFTGLSLHNSIEFTHTTD